MTFARPLVTLVAAWTLWIHQADAYSSLPDDLYAYPKYSIGFLNGLPLPNVTAQHWLAHGLKGGEKEFLEQPWDHGSHGSSRPQITGGETINSDGPAGEPTSHRLERMRLGPGKEYLCLVPPPDEGKQSSEAPPPPPSHPSKTWNLLQPLTGKCLYHRQGWFTYSYCHNDHVRQFRETAHGLPHPIQGRIPEEDNEWEAYNLGVSPAAKQKTGNDVSRRQAEAAAANLELQRAADQRYLVQRWGDGTQCDKTGRKREIEIQFHCSMSSVDQIMFVKEVSLCNYLIVIHTPRICSEPGFKSQRDSVKAAPIRCRQVVAQDTVEFDRSQIESPVPHTLAPARPILPPAHAMPAAKKTEAKKPKSLGEEAKQAEFVKAALGALLKSHGEDRALAGKKFRIELDDGVQELDFTDVGADAVDAGEVPDLDTVRQRIMQGLKAAGYDVVTDEWPEEGDGKGKKTKDDKGQKHAEL